MIIENKNNMEIYSSGKLCYSITILQGKNDGDNILSVLIVEMKLGILTIEFIVCFNYS